jgi:hypothetical protein
MVKDNYKLKFYKNSKTGKIKCDYSGKYNAFGTFNEKGKPIMYDFGDFRDNKLIVEYQEFAGKVMESESADTLTIQFKSKNLEQKSRRGIIGKCLDFLISGFEIL